MEIGEEGLQLPLLRTSADRVDIVEVSEKAEDIWLVGNSQETIENADIGDRVEVLECGDSEGAVREEVSMQWQLLFGVREGRWNVCIHVVE